MDEARWLRCTDPGPMLELVRGKVSERKLRLFGCACCRRLFPLFTDPRGPAAVEVVEHYADGLASRTEMAQAEQAASDARGLTLGQAFGQQTEPQGQPRSWVGVCTSWAAYVLTNVPDTDAGQTVWEDTKEAAEWAHGGFHGRVRKQKQAQADLLRCIVGNPFRPPAFDGMANLGRAQPRPRNLRGPALGRPADPGRCFGRGWLRR